MTSVKTVPDDEITSKIKDGYVAGDDLSHTEYRDVEHPLHRTGDAAMYMPADSFAIDRWFDRLPWARRWSIAMIGAILLLLGVILFLAPVVTDWRNGGTEIFPAPDVNWFRPLFPPLVTVYILIVIQLLERTRESVAQSLRPLVQVDDEKYVAVVRRACRANPVGEIIGFGIGAAFFLAIEGRFHGPPGYYWISFYYYVTSLIMFGAIGWSVFAVITITRMTNALLRQPIEVDIFDVAPLEPIGMQSLYLSLAFLGAVVLSFPSSPYPFLSWQNTAIYGVMTLIIVLVFFVNMYGTHGLLASTKKRHTAVVQREFAQTYRQLRHLAASHQDTHVAATDLNAWSVAKHELKATRTWPYNTEMLRTLFISIMMPLAVGISRLVAALLASGGL